MLNRAPIFINGLSRGGTTLLTNLLASHPDVCLVGETHQVFKGASLADSPWRVLEKCLRRDAPIVVGQTQDFFSPRLIEPRKPLSQWAKLRIDRILFAESLAAEKTIAGKSPSRPVVDKSPRTADTSARQGSRRMLAKNIDGMIFASDAWFEMYPDARFFGLVRHGLAVCEGHVRRGRSATEIGWRFQVLVEKLLNDARHRPNVQIVRFEDLVSNPWETLCRTCAHADLDVGQVDRIRMQLRRFMDADGNHQLAGRREWEVVWLQPHELDGYFHAAVNDNQIARLSKSDRDAFLRQAGDAMELLGYDTSSSPTTHRQSAISVESTPTKRQTHGKPFQLPRAA